MARSQGRGASGLECADQNPRFSPHGPSPCGSASRPSRRRRSTALPREVPVGRFGDRPPHKRRPPPGPRTLATTKLPMAREGSSLVPVQHPHLCSLCSHFLPPQRHGPGECDRHEVAGEGIRKAGTGAPPYSLAHSLTDSLTCRRPSCPWHRRAPPSQTRFPWADSEIGPTQAPASTWLFGHGHGTLSGTRGIRFRVRGPSPCDPSRATLRRRRADAGLV
jgi:hypothetical protein